MNETEKMHNKHNDALHQAGWAYLGCDYWCDPMTTEKFLTHTARQVQKARARQNKKRAPKLLLCSDWEGIRKELRKQLKPHGLTVNTKGNYNKWGDRLLWTVVPLNP
jgi:hypothetical protein